MQKRLAERIDIRITSAEKAEFEIASELAELSLSEWMRAPTGSRTARNPEVRQAVAERAGYDPIRAQTDPSVSL